jgi:hypothetical protein
MRIATSMHHNTAVTKVTHATRPVFSSRSSMVSLPEVDHNSPSNALTDRRNSTTNSRPAADRKETKQFVLQTLLVSTILRSHGKCRHLPLYLLLPETQMTLKEPGADMKCHINSVRITPRLLLKQQAIRKHRNTNHAPTFKWCLYCVTFLPASMRTPKSP